MGRRTLGQWQISTCVRRTIKDVLQSHSSQICTVSSEGTYAIAPIQADLDIPDFPVGCYFMIEDAKNAADAVSGARFTMASTKGVASTYGLEATVAASSATKTGTGASATTDADSSNGTATGSISASGGQGASSATGSNAVQTGVAAASSSSDGSLSSGAKAGLAIGIILAVIAILAGVFFFFRRSKRQMQRLDSNAGANTTEKVAAAAAGAGAGGARPSDVNDTGPETLVTPAFSTQANNRNSEDWRRFFGSGAVKREPAAS